jgi:uncharacterized membrane protein
MRGASQNEEEDSAMESKAKLFGHAIHPMLVVFPLGLLATSVVFDIVGIVTGNGTWSFVAYYLIGAGIVGGLLAAVFGTIDWLAIPKNTRAWRIGLLHGVGNVIVVGLFAMSWLLRLPSPATPSGVALGLSIVAISLSVITGWLGGELVGRLGVGVSPNAHLDAPSSLGSVEKRSPELRAQAHRGSRA